MACHGVALSPGSTYRPANTVDALDHVHRRELELQSAFVREAQRFGVPVIFEAVGHMKLADAQAFVTIIREHLQFTGPIMTLGPIPTDAPVGEGDIANAAGVAFLT